MISISKKKSFKCSIIGIVLVTLIGCIALINYMKYENQVKYEVGDKIIEIDKLLEYKDSYVGDNSAVGNILGLLPGNIFFHKFSLETTKQPYSIKVNYEFNENIISEKETFIKFYGLTEDFIQHYGLKEGSKVKLRNEDFENYWNSQNIKKIFVNNASILFALVKNVDIIKFDLYTKEKQLFSITREELECFYNRDLREYAEDKLLWKKEIFNKILNSDKNVDNFFNI